MKKRLLIISSGNRIYREYALRSIATHYDLMMLHDEPLTWQEPYLIDFKQIDITDKEKVLAAARALAQRHQIAGILTYDEPSLEVTAAAAENLQLRHHCPASARLCRDKFAMRQTWDRAGVPSARSRLVFSLQEAGEAANQIGYPVVLKPRSMAASIGVIRADSPEQLTRAYAVASLELHPVFRGSAVGTLVEEYLVGPEISVESVVVDGQVSSIAITRKQLGLAPHFEEVGHVVSPGEPLGEEAAIREVVAAAHRAFNIQYGVTHAELRLTERGPRMIELNGRSAGDLIPYLVYLATGIDLPLASAQVAVGDPPTLSATHYTTAAIQFIYPTFDGYFRECIIDTTAFQHSWIEKIVCQRQPGEELYLPPRGFIPRLGFVIVTGTSMAECAERIEHARSYVHIAMEPLIPQEV
ncbi:MAG: ATP-grasp domain-containing protein [Ktedonobacteraceae bacterium]|nr:ATP-grasp domain-containing protein [Ktedonobacteraceae bacterium]